MELGTRDAWIVLYLHVLMINFMIESKRSVFLSDLSGVMGHLECCTAGNRCNLETG